MITEKLKKLVKDARENHVITLTDEIVNELSDNCDPTGNEIGRVFGGYTSVNLGALYKLLKASRKWTFPES